MQRLHRRLSGDALRSPRHSRHAARRAGFHRGGLTAAGGGVFWARWCALRGVRRAVWVGRRAISVVHGAFGVASRVFCSARGAVCSARGAWSSVNAPRWGAGPESEAGAKQLSEQRAALRLHRWRQQKLRSSGIPLGHHGTASSSLPVGLKQNLVHTALFRREHRRGVTCTAVAFESGRGNKVTTRLDINRERRIFTFQFFMCSTDHQPGVARSGRKGINTRAAARPSNSVSHLGNVSSGRWYINCASSHGSDEGKADRI